MKNYLIFVLTLSLILIHCQNRLNIFTNSQSSVEKKNIVENEHSSIMVRDSILTPFQQTLLLVKTIDLPIDFVCGIDNYQFVNSCSENLKSIFPKNERINGIIGKLPPYKDKEILLFCSVGDINYPYIYIYDKNGIIIDSLYLHFGFCSADGEERNVSRTVINFDYSIDMYDTTEYYHYKLKTIEIDSLMIIHKNYQINSKYKFLSSFEEKQILLK